MRYRQQFVLLYSDAKKGRPKASFLIQWEPE
jgi:hypothetical protein